MEDDNMFNKYRKYIIGIIVVLLGVIGSIQYYNLSVFRIVSTSPATNRFSVYSPFFKINFSQIPASSNINITYDTNAFHPYRIEGKSLVFDNAALEPGKNYRIHILSLSSSRGKIITDKVISFKTQDISPTKLPADQQDALVTNQDRYGGPTMVSNPILAHLPHETLEYSMSAVIVSGDRLEIDVKLLLSAADVRSGETIKQSAIDNYKKSALDYILSLGLKPENYTIIFTPIEPTL